MNNTDKLQSTDGNGKPGEIKIADAIKTVEDFAPLALSADFDRCGLKVGDVNRILTGILTTVDTDVGVVNEAVRKGCNLIIEHHPSIWRPLEKIDVGNPLDSALIAAIKFDVAVYSAHTNVDYAEGGLNDCVARKLGLSEIMKIGDEGSPRIGKLKKRTVLKKYAEFVAEIFDDDNVMTVGDLSKEIEKVAVVNGGGGNSEAVRATFDAGADVYVTGDVKHSAARLAKNLNYAIIQVGHFSCEAEFMPLIKKVIERRLRTPVFLSESMGSPYNRRSELWT